MIRRGIIGAVVLASLAAGGFQSARAQWKQVFPSPYNSTPLWHEINDIVYFLDEVGHPEIGFASFWEGTFRTSNGGNTWSQIPSITNGQPLVDLTFKDSLTGWSASGMKTTDGGLTWSDMNMPNAGAGGAKGIHFVSSKNFLFLSYWYSGSAVSTDEGNTWNFYSPVPGSGISNGYAFVDDMNGINGTTEFGTPPSDGIIRTSDGGVTWTYNPTPVGCWQPYAQKQSSTFCYVSEYDNSFRRSTDFGATWNTVSYLGLNQTGCLKQDSCGDFYSQGSTYALQGRSTPCYYMSISTDNGSTWNSIGGPSNCVDTRFYIVGSKVFAQDNNPNTSGLWVYNGPSGTPSIAVPNLLNVLSTNCDTQFIVIPFQSLGCIHSEDTLTAVSLSASGSYRLIPVGVVPRGYINGDSVEIAYHPNTEGFDTALVSLSFIVGDSQFSRDVQIIGKASRQSALLVSDSAVTLSTQNCQVADTVIKIFTSGCPMDVDSIVELSVSGSNAFAISVLDTLPRRFNLEDSIRVRYIPSDSERDTAVMHLRVLVAGKLVDTTIMVYGETPGSSFTNLNLYFKQQTITTAAGDTLDIPVYLSGNTSLDSTYITLPFGIDTNVLRPIGFHSLNPGLTNDTIIYSNGVVNVPLQLDSITLNGETLLGYLRCIVYLADTLATTVTLQNASLTWVNAPCVALSLTTDSVNILINGCGDKTLLQFMKSGQVPLGIQSIVPNPSTDAFQINFINPTSSAISYQVVDMLGTVRAEGSVSETALTLDVQTLPNGLYYLRARNATTGFIASGRFVVER